MSRLPRWSFSALAFALPPLGLPTALLGQTEAQAPADAPDLVLRVGTVHPVSGPAFQDGVLVIAHGRLAAVGPSASVPVPAGVPVLSLPTAHAYPGLVDAWSQAFLPAAGFGEGGAGTDVAAGLDRFTRDGHACVAGGITTAHVLPAGGSKWSGTGALVRPRADAFAAFADGRTGGELLRLTGDPNQHPVARYKDLLDLGRVFEEAEAYAKARAKYADQVAKYDKDWAAYLAALRSGAKPESKGSESKGNDNRGNEGPPDEAKAGEPVSPEEGKPAPAGPKRPSYPKQPPLDPQKEALLAVAAGKVPLWVEAQRREEIRAALGLLADTGLRRGVLLGCLEAPSVLDELAGAGVGVVLTPTGLPTKLDGEPVPAHLARALLDKGVPVAIASGSKTRSAALTLMAAACVGDDLPEDAAVRAITLTPAELLGIATDVGSLEVGKRADVVLTSAPILRSEARVLRVLADGRSVYQGR